AVGDAELLEPLTIDFDRIALLPFFKFALGAIFGRVGARMAAVPIGHALDQRRAVAGARFLVSRGGGAIDLIGIVAVDDDARQAIGRGAIGGRVLHGGDVADRRIFHVQIVLADA